MKVKLMIGIGVLFFVFMPLISWATPIMEVNLEETNPALVLLPEKPVMANLCPAINLPAKTVIYLGFPGEKNPNAKSRFDIVFNYSNELKGSFLGWCVDSAHDIEKWAEHLVQLFSSCNWEALPSWIRGEAWKLRWNRINYILNHKEGANQEDIQNAIWAITNPEKERNLSVKAQLLLAEAQEHGANFIPENGVVAVICLTKWGKQMVIFEMPIEEAAMAIPPTPPSVPAAAPPLVKPPLFPPIGPPVFPPGGDNPPDGPKPPDHPKPVPEPSTMLLLGSGLTTFLFFKGREK